MIDKINDPIKWLESVGYKLYLNHIGVKLRKEWPAIAKRYDELTDQQKRIFFDCICDQLVYKNKVDEFHTLYEALPEDVKSRLHEVVIDHMEELMDCDDIGD